MSFVFDCSFGHDRMTPTAVDGAGASGVVLYAGCQDGRKNATKAEVQALLDHGLMVGLVIENGPQDMSQGRGLGIQYATNLYTAAQALGYDRDGCVLFTAADWDVTATDVAMVDQFMQGFREVIPVPGLYGDREALDYCAQRGHAVGFWQTDAMGWSGGETSTHAHMQQRFNDPRAHGLPVDVNDLLRTDLPLMGADMTSPAQTEAIVAKYFTEYFGSDGMTAWTAKIAAAAAAAVWAAVAPDAANHPVSMTTWLTLANKYAQLADAQANTNATTLAAIQDAVSKLSAAPPGSVDAEAVVKALAAALDKGTTA